jgi:hypothetical protein
MFTYFALFIKKYKYDLKKDFFILISVRKDVVIVLILFRNIKVNPVLINK